MMFPTDEIDIAQLYEQSDDRERQAIRMAKAWIDGWTKSPHLWAEDDCPVFAAGYERVVTMLAALLLRFDEERA